MDILEEHPGQALAAQSKNFSMSKCFHGERLQGEARCLLTWGDAVLHNSQFVTYKQNGSKGKWCHVMSTGSGNIQGHFPLHISNGEWRMMVVVVVNKLGRTPQLVATFLAAVECRASPPPPLLFFGNLKLASRPSKHHLTLLSWDFFFIDEHRLWTSRMSTLNACLVVFIQCFINKALDWKLGWSFFYF